MKTKTKQSKKTATSLSDAEKGKMIRSHEDGNTVHELATKYGITPQSVAAYVANAHR